MAYLGAQPNKTLTKTTSQSFNGTGSAIWNLLEQPADVEQLLTELLDLYDVDSSTCRQETEAFIAEALKRGMLQVQTPA